MNLKEITWQDAEKLEPGSKLWVGQTRDKAVEGTVSSRGQYSVGDKAAFTKNFYGDTLNLTPYIPTPDAVDIGPAEAAARMVEGLPVECRKGTTCDFVQTGSSLWNFADLQEHGWQFRIPACEPAKQKLTIEVDAGVEVPDEIFFLPQTNKSPLISAKVIHREAK